MDDFSNRAINRRYQPIRVDGRLENAQIFFVFI